MEKLDLTKKYKTYFTAKTKPEIVEIERAQFLSIVGKGAPSDKEYAEKIQALFTTAYSIKFISKALDKDFTVSKLECLWWFDENKYKGLSIMDTPKSVPRNEWEYRLLIRMPDFVTEKQFEKGIQDTISKKKLQLANDVEFYKMTEGKCIQMLHVGPFSTEPETLAQMYQLLVSSGLSKNGHHHEIYLSDHNKTSPEKMKTILREPVK